MAALLTPCVGFDWFLSVFAVLYALYIFLLKRELWLGSIFRLFNAVLLGIAFGDYVYVAYLLPYVNQDQVAIFVAVITVLVVLILLYWLDNSAIMLMVLVVMSSYGLVWWLTSILAVLVGVIAAFIIWRNEIDYLTMCLTDSAVLSIVILVNLVGIITNFWPSNAPDDCSTTQHVNILLICETSCGSVLTDGNIRLRAWTWGIIVVVMTAARFVWVYWAEVCGREKQVKQAYEAESPPKQSSCCCCCIGPLDQRDLCFCLWRCCASERAFQPLASDTTSTQLTPGQKKAAAPTKTERKRRQQQQEEEDLELELALAAVSEAEQQQQQEGVAQG